MLSGDFDLPSTLKLRKDSHDSIETIDDAIIKVRGTNDSKKVHLYSKKEHCYHFGIALILVLSDVRSPDFSMYCCAAVDRGSIHRFCFLHSKKTFYLRIR